MMKRLTTMLCGLGFGVFISSLLLLAGCAKEEDPNRLPDGQYPMTFTASVEGLTATRATTDNSWTGGELIAVSVDNLATYTTYQITDAATGAMAPNVAGEACYWQFSKNQPIRAWYPAEGGTDVDISDQSGGYASFDYLTSDGTYDLAQTVALPFKHQMAKVKYTLVPGEGISESDLASATVQIYGFTKASFASGTLSGHTDGWVMPYAAGHEAIVVPQQMLSKKFIRVTAGGNDYFYTPATDANLEAGKQYTYNITVQKNGITVTASGATEWTGSTITVESKEIKQGFAATDLKIGDYYYSDGTWSDGGLRKLYTDGTFVKENVEPVLADANNQPRTVVGIVYWVGDPTNSTDGDPLLKTQHPGCTHGLVVALQDAGSNSFWSSSYDDITANWLKNQTGYGITSLKEKNKMQGYANTQALIGYNTTSSNVQNNSNLKVLPIEAITTTYASAHPTPASSSGWYFPSVMELKYMCWGQGNSSGTAGRDFLNAQLGKVSGVSLQSDYYWSSTEVGDDWAWNVDFSYGYVDYDFKDGGSYVRSVLAF